MALILNLETATNICSVSLADSGKTIATLESSDNKHAEVITLLIEQIMSNNGVGLANLDAVAISHGPGSYTSLRVGASTAKGLCYALNIPLISVDTLLSMAYAAYKEYGDKTALYCPMIDARRMEVYTAVYGINDNAESTRVTEKIFLMEELNNLIVDANSFERYFSEKKRLIFVGNGSDKCVGTINTEGVFLKQVVCSSRHMCALSEAYFEQKKFESLAYYTPEYLKSPNITTAKKIF